MNTGAIRPAGDTGRRANWVLALVAIAVVVVGAPRLSNDPRLVRGAVVAGVCLVLWLTEVVPLYATTLLLWVGIATVVGPVDRDTFSRQRVLSAAANPVMALFFGGFALSAAGARYGLTRRSRGRWCGCRVAGASGCSRR